jgi:hypothetical protein
LKVVKRDHEHLSDSERDEIAIEQEKYLFSKETQTAAEKEKEERQLQEPSVVLPAPDSTYPMAKEVLPKDDPEGKYRRLERETPYRSVFDYHLDDILKFLARDGIRVYRDDPKIGSISDSRIHEENRISLTEVKAIWWAALLATNEEFQSKFQNIGKDSDLHLRLTDLLTIKGGICLPLYEEMRSIVSVK